MRYTYGIILYNKRFILIEAVIGLHILGDCDKCVFDDDCYHNKGVWLCNELNNKVRYISNSKQLIMSLIISSYVKMHRYYII